MHVELCLAREEEKRSSLPGDGFIASPIATVNLAITIDVPRSEVWPWLMQMGSGRAGWYSYDHIDNGGRASARQIVPALQHVQAGDIMPWLPGARDGFVVGELESERYVVLLSPLAAPGAGADLVEVAAAGLRATSTLVLEDMDNGCATRLIARGRVSKDWMAPQKGPSDSPSKPVLIERIYGVLARLPRSVLLPLAGFGHYLFQARELRGIKQRAEGRWRSAEAGPASPGAAKEPFLSD